MRFLPSRKTLGTVALVLISGAALLVFSFLSNAWQREANHERAFTSLSVVSEQLETYLDGVRTLLLQSLKDLPPEDYIKMRLPGYAPLTLRINKQAPTFERGGYLRLRRASTPQGMLWYAEYLGLPDAAGSQTAPQPKVWATLGLHFDDEVQRVIREFGSDRFSAILLATTTGEIITQTTASVVRVGTLRSLPLEGEKSAQPDEAKSPVAPGGRNSFALLSQYSNVVALRIAGALYNLYVQPVQLSFSFGEQPSTQLVICGLIRPDQDAGGAIPIRYSTLVFAAVVLVAGVSLLWPLLKMSLMREDERLRRSDVLLLALAILFIAVLLPTGMLTYVQMTERSQERRVRLASVAHRFQENVRKELRAIGDSIKQLEPQRTAGAESVLVSKAFHGLANGVEYPYFDSLFWIDEQGYQRVKISAESYPSPLTNIRQTPLFEHVRTGDGESVGAGSERVIVEPVMGGFAGAFAVAVGLPFPAPRLPGAEPYFAAVVVTRLLSLVRPLLPAGESYAVINREGKVLFHEVTARNLIENFYHECPSPEIRAAVEDQTEAFVRSRYAGVEYDFYVAPFITVSGAPTSLLVYSRTTEVTGMATSTFLVTVMILGPFLGVLGAAILMWLQQDRTLSSLWPDPRQLQAYAIVAGLNCLVAIFAVGNLIFNPAKALGIATLSMLTVPAGIWVSAWSALYADGGMVLMSHRRRLVARLFAVAVLGTVAGFTSGVVPAVALAFLIWMFSQYGPYSRPQYIAARQGLPLQPMYSLAIVTSVAMSVMIPAACAVQAANQSAAWLWHHRELQEERRAAAGRTARLTREFDAIAGGDRVLDKRLASILDRYDTSENARQSGSPPAAPIWLRALTDTVMIHTLGREQGPFRLASIRAPRTGDYPEDGRQAPAGGAVSGPWMVACLGLSTLAAGALVFVIIRRLFGTPREAVRFLEWRGLSGSKTNLLVLCRGLSGHGSGRSLGDCTIDVENLDEVQSGRFGFDRKIMTVAITNLDSHPEDITGWPRRFDAIERIQEAASHRGYDDGRIVVTIFTCINPMYYLRRQVKEREGAAAENWRAILDRAAALLYHFPLVILDERGSRWDMPPAVAEEFGQTLELQRLAEEMLPAYGKEEMSRDQVTNLATEIAAGYYRVVWSECTREERDVLAQLAFDGWTNPARSDAIQELMRKGLVVRNRGLRLMNRSFRMFVMQVAGEDMRKLEESQMRSSWPALRGAIMTAFVLASAWLLYLNRDVYVESVAFITALGGGVAAVMSLIGKTAKPET